ncbi:MULTISPECIES: hypothetical protein [unclassified Moraxella]|uniref:hypothetical protein n=1 Tax=unclassified Moraxella TaxID=2685852 RepID=UPI00359E7922
MNTTQHKDRTKTLLKKGVYIGALATIIGTLGKMSGKRLLPSMSIGLITALGATTLISSPAHAISESSVQAYASAMSNAANSKNIGQVARLVSNEAIISLTRNGKTANLDKNNYLQLLQTSWAKSTNYHYDIAISDIIVSGNQARAQVITTETWLEDGKPVKLITTSRVTLSSVGGSAVLLRSVSQVAIN